MEFNENEIGAIIIDTAVNLHKKLGRRRPSSAPAARFLGSSLARRTGCRRLRRGTSAPLSQGEQDVGACGAVPPVIHLAKAQRTQRTPRGRGRKGKRLSKAVNDSYYSIFHNFCAEI